MHQSANFIADPAAELAVTALVELAVQELIENGLGAAPALFEALAARGLAADDELLIPLLTEMLSTVLDQLGTDDCSLAVYALFERLAAPVATAAFNLLLIANFPEGKVDLAALDDAALLCFTGLLTAADRAENAVALIVEAGRKTPGFRYAEVVARSQGAGPARWWPAMDGIPGGLDGARERVAAASLDIPGYRALARGLFEAGNIDSALTTIATALALPIAEAEKLPIADDMTIIASVLVLQGKRAIMFERRLRWALAGAPAVAARAIALVGDAAANPLAPLLGAYGLIEVESYFRELVPAPGSRHAALSPYALRDGKPYVETVWLEVTNHCNQKCGFCPDMHREDARTWLPLAKIKQLIDEMAETVSVGSMQLNAYGEPLLHPNIDEILAYIRAKQLPWPTFFTTHGMTLVEKKLKQLSHNYPTGIAVSLHNDSQESYAATRSAKIGDYDTLVARVSGLLRQMVSERAACHMRLYQMVCNGHEDWQVDPVVRGAFPDSAERMMLHVRKWEGIAAEIAEWMPAEVEAEVMFNTPAHIEQCFREASHGDGHHLPILQWRDVNGTVQTAFMSPRPVGTYANLLLEYDDRWKVERQVVNPFTCSFTNAPSLAIFATGRMGICCLDMNSTATFGALSDYPSLADALLSPEALRMFAEVSNGVATSRGCQICLGTGKQVCKG